jgi:hypothetical protein
MMKDVYLFNNYCIKEGKQEIKQERKVSFKSELVFPSKFCHGHTRYYNVILSFCCFLNV